MQSPRKVCKNLNCLDDHSKCSNSLKVRVKAFRVGGVSGLGSVWSIVRGPCQSFGMGAVDAAMRLGKSVWMSLDLR